MHKKTKTIFISRQLSSDSVFLDSFNPAKFNVIGKSLIEFKPILFKEVPSSDWLFFYSKNGVKYFFEQIAKPNALPQLATIGTSTAQYLEEHYPFQVSFIGTGDPQSTATQFLKQAKGLDITFVQAMQSKQSVQLLLGKQINSKSLIVYKNSPIKDIKNPDADILVFTSPMNAEIYFQHFPYVETLEIVAIGKSTAKTLKKLGIRNYLIADAPNEEALAKKVLELT
ncbi:MAG: uroporphyrinogen-III synthase [Aureispira sp.]|nr:uroporphyrinogen-III synthase [Aureispira sp.]